MLKTLIDVAGSLGWGVFSALLLTAIVLFIVLYIRGVDRQFTILSYGVAIGMAGLLAYQATMMVGAIRLKQTCYTLANVIDGLIPQQGVIGPDEVKIAVGGAATVVPFVADIVDMEDLAHYEKYGSIGNAITNKTQTSLNWYVVRRIAWMSMFMLLGYIGIANTMEIRTRVRSRRNSYRSRRR